MSLRSLRISVMLLIPVAALAQSASIPDQLIPLDVLRQGHVPVVRALEPERPIPIRPEPQASKAPNAVPKPRRPTAPPPILNLNVDDYVKLVGDRNQRILSHELEWHIAEQAVEGAKSTFEAEFVGSAGHEENNNKNTVEQALQRGNLAQFHEANEHYDAAVDDPLTGGGKLHAGYHLDDFNNNLQGLNVANGLDTFNEFRTFLGATLTQPLLRNRGPKVAKAKIHVAERDRDIAFQVYRKEMMRILGDAIVAYYDLAAAQKRLEFRRQSVRIAQNLLATNRERARLGNMAQTEVLDAESGLAQRRAQMEAATQEVVSATARVRNFISVSPESYEMTVITAHDDLSAQGADTDEVESLETATEMAPEYLAARSRAKREGIKVAYARNQLWPQLDLHASYGLNGLDTDTAGSFHDAFAADNPSWNFLMEMHLPLGGNTQARSELKAAQFRKKQALLEIKSTEVEMANALDAATKNVENAAAQIKGYREAAIKSQKLLQVEMQRLEMGVSTSRIVLQREEELNRSREELVRGQVNYKRAVLDLDLVRGTLLRRYGVDVAQTAHAGPEPEPEEKTQAPMTRSEQG